MDELTGRNGHTNGHDHKEGHAVVVERPAGRPIRKDERIVADRGLYIESWLPERRSRRKPLYLLHGELGGSWLWHRFLGYFAPRGWEGHALNLRGHYWSGVGRLRASLSFDTYLDDVLAGAGTMARPPIVIGHGLGGLLAMRLAQERPISALVLLSSALPAELLEPPPSHMVRLLPRQYRRELIGWDGPVDADPAPEPRPEHGRRDARPAHDGPGVRRGPATDARGRVGVARRDPAGTPGWSSVPGWTGTFRKRTASAWPSGWAPTTCLSARTRTTAWSPARSSYEQVAETVRVVHGVAPALGRWRALGKLSRCEVASARGPDVRAAFV